MFGEVRGLREVHIIDTGRTQLMFGEVDRLREVQRKIMKPLQRSTNCSDGKYKFSVFGCVHVGAAHKNLNSVMVREISFRHLHFWMLLSSCRRLSFSRRTC
jgi:hypothetical protein